MEVQETPAGNAKADDDTGNPEDLAGDDQLTNGKKGAGENDATDAEGLRHTGGGDNRGSGPAQIIEIEKVEAGLKDNGDDAGANHVGEEIEDLNGPSGIIEVAAKHRG